MRANVVAATSRTRDRSSRPRRDFLPFRRPLDRGHPEPRRGRRPATAAGPGSRGAAHRAARRPDARHGADAHPAAGERATADAEAAALATTRITWNDRSTQYTTVIAVLAAALFLVGFGLVVEGSIRRCLLRPGRRGRPLRRRVGRLDLPAADPVHSGRGDRRGRARRGAQRRRALPCRARASTIGRSRPTAVTPSPYTGRSRARLLAANPDYPATQSLHRHQRTRRRSSRDRRAASARPRRPP